MEERLTEILGKLSSIEEDLTDIAFQILSEYLQHQKDALEESSSEEKTADKETAARDANEIEKNLVKVRRAVEKAKQSLAENPLLNP